MKKAPAGAAPVFGTTAALIVAAGFTLVLSALLACSGRAEPSTAPGDPTPSAAPSATPLQPTVPPLEPTITPRPGAPAPDSGTVDPLPSPESLLPGEPYTFSLTVVNRGPSAATGVRVTQSLPPGIQFIGGGPDEQSECSTTGQGIYSATTVLCNLDFLAAGTAHTFALPVRPLTTTGMLTTSAQVVAREADPNPDDNRLDRRTLIEPVADLSLEMQASSPSGEPDLATYTLTVTNHGPAPATGVVLTGVLPAGTTLAWSRPASLACHQDGKTAGCQLGGLEGGRTATVTLDVTPGISQSLVAGTGIAGLALQLSGSTCAPVEGGLVCYLADLGAGQQAQVRFAIQRSLALSGTRFSTATVTATPPDPALANNTASAAATFAGWPLTRTDVLTTADLRLAVAAPAYALAGAPLSYTIHIRNAGAGRAEGVTFSATLASGMVVQSVRPSPPDCEAAPGRMTCRLTQGDRRQPATVTLIITSQVVPPTRLSLNDLAPGWPMCNVIPEATLSRAIRCTLGALPAGGTTQISFRATASGMLSRILTQTVQVTADSGDANPTNNRVEITTVLDVASDLLLRPALTEPAALGEVIKTLWTITNTGPSDANRVVFTAVLPSGVTPLTAFDSQEGTCEIKAGRVRCEVSRLDHGQAVDVVLTWRLDEPVEEPLQHVATVVAYQFDPHAENNTFTATIPLRQEADLSLTQP
jgi:uncharacterized repeat protein (TIGR01451 family)